MFRNWIALYHFLKKISKIKKCIKTIQGAERSLRPGVLLTRCRIRSDTGFKCFWTLEYLLIYTEVASGWDLILNLKCMHVSHTPSTRTLKVTLYGVLVSLRFECGLSHEGKVCNSLLLGLEHNAKKWWLPFSGLFANLYLLSSQMRIVVTYINLTKAHQYLCETLGRAWNTDIFIF